VIATDAQNKLGEHEPIGCVLAIMPGIFPFWQYSALAAPTLMAGNTGMLKLHLNVLGWPPSKSELP